MVIAKPDASDPDFQKLTSQMENLMRRIREDAHRCQDSLSNTDSMELQIF